MNIEKEHIARCKQVIAERFGFDDIDGLRQRDLEYLSDAIMEKSGTRLSLSTLKRLWKKDYDQTPHPATLDALVSIIGYNNWQEFKLEQPKLAGADSPAKFEKTKPFFRKWLALSVITGVVVLFWIIGFRSREDVRPLIKGPVTFKGNKTLAQGVPNTIIFNYDVSNIQADSFFFQQSWNEKEKVKIDPKGKYYSTIYYYPGFHKAKLIANDSIVGRFMAHITTDGWLPLVRYSFSDIVPVYIRKSEPRGNGSLQVTAEDLINANINTDKEFLLTYFNVREFQNTYSDNFSLETRMISDPANKSFACPGFEVVILTEVHIFYVRLIAPGCEREISIKMGETIQDGVNNDLSVFGRDIFQWQDIKVEVVNKKATIYLDNKPVHTLSFTQDFGRVVGVACNFAGIGAVDYVKMMNGENKTVLEDKF